MRRSSLWLLYCIFLALAVWLVASSMSVTHARGARSGVAITEAVTASASASSIYATNTSPFRSNTTGPDCGTMPTAYDHAAVSNGSQVGLTSHWGIVAGLLPSTTYYCRFVTDITTIFTITTSAAPVSTPLVSASLGTASVPVANQIAGDTFFSATYSDGVTMVASDDTDGWGRSVSANAMIGKFTSVSPFTGTNVNVMSNFGTQGTCIGPQSPTLSVKFFGLFTYHNDLYGQVARQQQNPCPGNVDPVKEFYGSIYRSTDRGLTWANFQTPAAFSAGPTIVDPGVSQMFASSQQCGGATFAMYGKDDGTVLGSPYRVDNADAYVYLYCSQVWDNGDSLTLARIPKAFLPTLDVSKIQYFTGGDGNLDANWSSSNASAALIINNAGKTSVAAVQYLPDASMRRYYMHEWYYASLSDISNTIELIYEAPHPWGPWTLIFTAPPNTPNGWYTPAAYQPSAETATANGSPVIELFAGDYQASPYTLNQRNIVLCTSLVAC